MSVRRRNIQSRLGRDLQLEQGRHQQLRGLMKIQQDLTARAMAERDKALEERDKARERCTEFLELTRELGTFFKGPSAPLKRDTPLFRLLERLAPYHVPATPSDMLEAIAEAAGINLQDVAASVGYCLPTGPSQT